MTATRRVGGWEGGDYLHDITKQTRQHDSVAQKGGAVCTEGRGGVLRVMLGIVRSLWFWS